jgi:DNA-binding NarL/FixJ family response regulator
MNPAPKYTIALVETQPLTAEGLKALLDTTPDCVLAASMDNLAQALHYVRVHEPRVVVADKAFGMQAVLEWAGEIKTEANSTGTVVWGNSLNEADALRLVQAGVRGVVLKTSPPHIILACIRAVAAGLTWMEESLFHQTRQDTGGASALTAREHQVIELVEQGYKNREIARELGIQPGTVKIHLKHIFEKTGVRGRYGLALSTLREKALPATPSPL